MAYFSNGTEGEMYFHQYCSRCMHESNDRHCIVWFLHISRNYDECNNPDSALHVLIPRDENGNNEQCSMFIEAQPTSDRCPICGGETPCQCNNPDGPL